MSRWYAGRWRTEEGIARRREAHRGRVQKTNARRVFGGSGYLGLAPQAHQAAELNKMVRDFRAQQKGAA